MIRKTMIKITGGSIMSMGAIGRSVMETMNNVIPVVSFGFIDMFIVIDNTTAIKMKNSTMTMMVMRMVKTNTAPSNTSAWRDWKRTNFDLSRWVR